MTRGDGSSFSEMIRGKLKSKTFIGAVRAYSAFPKNPRDAEYFCTIWEREIEAANGLLSGTSQSQVFNALTTVIKKKQGRGVVAGLVAMSYIYLNIEQHIGSERHNPSLERAATLASETAYSTGEAFCGSRAIKLCGDKADVKSIFREYRSYGHIWAALLCHEDYEGSKDCEEKNLRFMVLANFFRRELQIIANTQDWGMVSCPIPSTFQIDNLPSGPWASLAKAYETCRNRGGFVIPP